MRRPDRWEPGRRPISGPGLLGQDKKRPRVQRHRVTPLLQGHLSEAGAPCPPGCLDRMAGPSSRHLVVGKPSLAGPRTTAHTPAGRRGPQAAALPEEAAAGAQGRWRPCGVHCLLALLGTPAGGKVARPSPMSPAGLQEGFPTNSPRCPHFPGKGCRRPRTQGTWGEGVAVKPRHSPQRVSGPRGEGPARGEPSGNNGPTAGNTALAPPGAPGSRPVCGLREMEKGTEDRTQAQNLQGPCPRGEPGSRTRAGVTTALACSPSFPPGTEGTTLLSEFRSGATGFRATCTHSDPPPWADGVSHTTLLAQVCTPWQWLRS